MVSISTTRGGLKPALIRNTKTKTEVKFMFNPSEFEFKKSNNFKEEKTLKDAKPASSFKHGDGQKLSLKLHFDTLETGVDVRRYTVDLWKMLEVDDSTDPKQPPPVEFEWGKIYFKAVVTSIGEKFTAFDKEGTPLRCEVSLELSEWVEKTPKEIQYGGVNPAMVVKIEGMSLELLAAGVASAITAQTAASVLAATTRAIAAKNGIDNPLSIPNGTTITS